MASSEKCHWGLLKDNPHNQSPNPKHRILETANKNWAGELLCPVCMTILHISSQNTLWLLLSSMQKWSGRILKYLTEWECDFQLLVLKQFVLFSFSPNYLGQNLRLITYQCIDVSPLNSVYQIQHHMDLPTMKWNNPPFLLSFHSRAAFSKQFKNSCSNFLGI